MKCAVLYNPEGSSVFETHLVAHMLILYASYLVYVYIYMQF